LGHAAVDARLFPQFAAGGLGQRFAGVGDAAGQRPQPIVGTTHQQQLAVTDDDRLAAGLRA